ncbi:hypothetical protein [Corynebacterium hindlerae]|uniref:hypothetical protein n=1 Tax=Corynebacterium hindlerae TaxID=699041 RepID=UPI003AB0E78A
MGMGVATKGRASFNARHHAHGDGGKAGRQTRAKLLKEATRDLEEDLIGFYAGQNINITPEDTKQNFTMMNDGNGGYTLATDPAQILAYGDERLARAERKIGANNYSVSTLIVALPRTLCEEIKDYYDVPDSNRKRSRFVARDRAEAMCYFNDAVQHLADNVIPGGQAGVHCVSFHWDEATPHIHVMADTLGESEKQPGKLRLDYSRAYGQHRDVTYTVEDAAYEPHPQPGKVIGNKAKMRMHHARMREAMYELGWPVELNASERSTESLDKDHYAQIDDAYTRAEEREDQIEAMEAAVLDEAYERGMSFGKLDGEAERSAAKREREQAEAERKAAQSKHAEAQKLLQQAEAESRRIEAQRRRLEAEEREQAERLDAERADVLADAQSDRETAAHELAVAKRERAVAQQQLAAVQQQADSVLAQAREDAEQMKKDAADSAARTQAEALENIEPVRNQMRQADSEFLDKLLKNPNIRQQREKFIVDIKRGYFYKSVPERRRDDDRVNLTVAEYSQKYPARDASRPVPSAPQQQRDTTRDMQFGD